METPTYLEVLRVGWWLFWRGIGGFFALLFLSNLLLLSLLPELSRTSPSTWVTLVPLSVATLGCVFGILPVIARALVRKQFRGFHLQFVRQAAPTSTGAFAGGDRTGG
jgi:hypothetical protein